MLFRSGQNFSDAFLNKQTRSYDAISNEEMQMYLKLMGGKTLGTMTAEQSMITDLFSGQLKLTKPEIAWRAQSFYDLRTKNYPDFYKKQSDYFKLATKTQKNAYLAKNQDLKQYWDWRRQFMTQNPDLVQYLTDDPKAIAKAKNSHRNPTVAVPTAQELQANVSSTLNYFLTSYFRQGQDLPPEAEKSLELMAAKYNLSTEQLMGILKGGG